MEQTTIIDDCRKVLPARAVDGLRLFNQGHFFEAHEALEDAWRAEKGPIRDLYRAILQIGLGYFQILGRNYQGAVKMFKRCKRWLRPFPDSCQGINLKDLRQNLIHAEEVLLLHGPEHIHEFPRQLIKPLKFTLPASADEPTALN